MLHCGDLTFTLLLDEDLVEVAAALDSPRVARFLCYDDVTDVRWAVSRRWRRDVAGESMTLVIRREGRIVGWTGLLMLDDVPGELQTSTFLHPDAWGRGINVIAKHVLWAMTELLGRDRLYFSIDSRNERSLAAAWKLFPDATVLRLAAPNEPGVDLVLAATSAPRAPGALDEAQRAALAALIARHPGYHVWRAAADADTSGDGGRNQPVEPPRAVVATASARSSRPS